MTFFGFRTIIGIFRFFRLLLFFVLFAMGVQLLLRRTAFPLKKGEGMAFAIFGTGPLFCGLYLFLNFMIPVKSEVRNRVVKSTNARGGSIYFNVDDIPCKEYPELCVVFMAGKTTFKSGDTIAVRLEKGIGGYEVLKKVEIIWRAPSEKE